MPSTRRRLERLRLKTALIGVAGLLASITGFVWSAHDFAESLPSIGTIGELWRLMNTAFFSLDPAGFPLAIAGTLAVACAVLMGRFGGRCGSCKRPLGRILAIGSGLFGIPPTVSFCPYCGGSLDDPAR